MIQLALALDFLAYMLLRYVAWSPDRLIHQSKVRIDITDTTQH